MPDYPSLDKSWNYNVNQALAAQGSAAACNQNLLYQIVNTLTSFSPGWQVRGSSNGTTFSLLSLGAAGPGTGWSGPSSVVFAGGASPVSWIVLRNTALGSGHPEILLTSYNQFNGSEVNFYISPSAGFTGGGITAATFPTATDMVTPVSGGLPGTTYGTVNANVAYAMHAEMSTDGQCTRLWIFQGGVFQTMWIIDAAKNPVSGWATPWTWTSYYSAAVPANTGIAPCYGGGPNNSSLNFWWTGEGTSSGLITTLYNAPNDLKSEYPMLPIGLFAPPNIGITDLAGRAGRLGMFYDLWWGVAALTSGQTYAGASAHAFVQINTQIFPWSGAATMNTS